MDPISTGVVIGGDFRIERPLSQGAMGQVYLVTQLSTRSRRALKLMHPALLLKPELRERFEREARVSAEIASDHVVQVLAAGIDEELCVPWLVMEFLEGRTLDAMVREQGPPPFDTARILFAQLAHGLTQAHAKGIVHRDLKPENLFIAAARTTEAPFCVKVLDFGIAKILGSTTDLTAALGTPLYMAPEQTDAGNRIGPHTDVWAAALVAFFTFTGRHYWRSANNPTSGLPALMREVIFDEQDPASRRAREFGATHPLPQGFDQWFARCTSRIIEQRPATAQAFAELDAMLARSSTQHLPAVNPLVTEAPPHPQTQSSSQNLLPATQGLTSAPNFQATEARPRKRPWLLALPLAMTLVVGLLMVAFVIQQRRGTHQARSTSDVRADSAKQGSLAAPPQVSTNLSTKRQLKISCDPACSLIVNGSTHPAKHERTIVLPGKGDLRVVFDLVKSQPRLLINTGVDKKPSAMMPDADTTLTCFDSCWLTSDEGIGGRGAAYVATRGRRLHLRVEPGKKHQGFPLVTYSVSLQ
ncbi:MAG: serine/threonine protein kinase [Myxococcales bacterium]|nr:serine/threonine protein kinase [Myxococcales bacterium]